MRLAIIASHPIQYHAPLFRELARQLDVTVLFAHRVTPEDQAEAGFGVPFSWDMNVLEGYEHFYLDNVARRAGIDRFLGCDTPDVGARLADGKYDAVLLNGWHLKTYLQSAYAAKRLHLPLLVRGDSQLQTPRSSLKNVIKRAIYPAFLRLFDAALYVGKRSRAYWLHYGYPPDRLFFSPHCVDTEWFGNRATSGARSALRARIGVSEEAKVVLFAGKLVPFKRPLDVVEAVHILRVRGGEASVLVAGDGKLKDAMIRRAYHLKVPLYYLGFCNQTEMPDAYAAADVLVLPSDGHETWGLVANEALACGRPIILSDAAGAGPDLADDGDTGRIFPATNVAALAESIGDVLRDPPSAGAIAAKSRAYSPAAAADGVIEALGEMA